MLRVLNLFDDVTEQDVDALFSPFGALKNKFIAVDPNTGRSAGFAFISYVNEEDENRALRDLDGSIIRDNVIHVELAISRT
jgi:RNA recognition motif-containing protein